MDGRPVTPLGNGMQHWTENQASGKCSRKWVAFVKHRDKVVTKSSPGASSRTEIPFKFLVTVPHSHAWGHKDD